MAMPNFRRRIYGIIPFPQINTTIRSKFSALKKGWRANPEGLVSFSRSRSKFPFLQTEVRRGSVGRPRQNATSCRTSFEFLLADTTPALRATPSTRRGI